MEFYFEYPVQVKFKDEAMVENGEDYLGGIAYQDFIICGECGGIVRACIVSDMIELPWVDINECIAGEEA